MIEALRDFVKSLKGHEAPEEDSEEGLKVYVAHCKITCELQILEVPLFCGDFFDYAWSINVCREVQTVQPLEAG